MTTRKKAKKGPKKARVARRSAEPLRTGSRKSVGKQRVGTRRRALASPEPGATAGDPVPETEVAKEAWMFCKDKTNRYVDPTTRWSEFRDGVNSMLRFHTGAMPSPALKTAIERFASELDEWMLDHGFEGRDIAPKEIRLAIAAPSEPLANLLRVADANYREAT